MLFAMTARKWAAHPSLVPNRLSSAQQHDFIQLLTSDRTNSAMLFATRAQQWAAHPTLVPSRHSSAQPHDSIRRQMRELWEEFESTELGEDSDGPHPINMLMKYLKVLSQTATSSREAEGDKENTDGDYDPNKKVGDANMDDDVSNDEEAEKVPRTELQEQWFTTIRDLSDEDLNLPRVTAICCGNALYALTCLRRSND